MKKTFIIIGSVLLALVLLATSYFYIVPLFYNFEKPLAGVSSDDNKYQSPIDFQKLEAQNPDIYAWIEIPNTEISYAVVQHPKDDTYYLRRNEQGFYMYSGAIFSEASYNKKDFNDPVTILYGHAMLSGKMFGRLRRTYSGGKHNADDIVIYQKNQELHYKVFASLPYSDQHILYSYDFSNPSIFNLFFDQILFNKSLGTVINSDVWPVYSDKVIILSTCMSGGNKRFLVMAKLIKKIS